MSFRSSPQRCPLNAFTTKQVALPFRVVDAALRPGMYSPVSGLLMRRQLRGHGKAAAGPYGPILLDSGLTLFTWQLHLHTSHGKRARKALGKSQARKCQLRARGGGPSPKPALRVPLTSAPRSWRWTGVLRHATPDVRVSSALVEVDRSARRRPDEVLRQLRARGGGPLASCHTA